MDTAITSILFLTNVIVMQHMSSWLHGRSTTASQPFSIVPLAITTGMGANYVLNDVPYKHTLMFNLGFYNVLYLMRYSGAMFKGTMDLIYDLFTHIGRQWLQYCSATVFFIAVEHKVCVIRSALFTITGVMCLRRLWLYLETSNDEIEDEDDDKDEEHSLSSSEYTTDDDSDTEEEFIGTAEKEEWKVNISQIGDNEAVLPVIDTCTIKLGKNDKTKCILIMSSGIEIHFDNYIDNEVISNLPVVILSVQNVTFGHGFKLSHDKVTESMRLFKLTFSNSNQKAQFVKSIQ